MQANLHTVRSTCVAFRRCWIYRTHSSGNPTEWLQPPKMTRRHFCVRCVQMSSSLLSAKYLGSTMHICFLLSQIASCSKSWCYSYTHNSKRPLDLLLTVKNNTSQEYRENYKTTQQTIWRSNENVRGKTCFFNLVISTSFPVIAHKCWHWENKTNKTLYCCFIGVLVALQYVRFSLTVAGPKSLCSKVITQDCSCSWTE